MHYKNGKPANIGDEVVGYDTAGNLVSGTVVKTTPGSDSCNIEIVPSHVYLTLCTSGDCYLEGDAKLAESVAEDAAAEPVAEPVAEDAAASE